MRFYDYYFDDIPVTVDDRPALAKGSFCVQYILTRPDPSVGFRGGPEIVDHSDLSVTLFFEDDETSREIASGEMDIKTVVLRQLAEYIDPAHIYDELEAEHGEFW
jgi:hypothetical protein